MNTKRRRLFALLLGLVLVLSFVMLAACDNGEEEEPQGPVYTIGLSAQVLELERYGRGELTATVYKDGVATTDSVTWSSANTAVATVSGGVVVAVGEGSAQITAAAQGQTAACTVMVTDEGIVPQLVVADTTIPLTYRADDPGYYDILAEVEFYDYDTSDAVISYEAVTSDTSDPSVIELSSEGRVTAKKAGRATVLVSATWNGYTCTEVPVSVVVYDDIEVRLLDEEDVALTPGETSALYTWAGTVEGNTFTKSETFGAKVLKKTEEVADATVEWQTSDAAVAEVKDGVVTAKAEGTAEIWCEYTEGDFVYESLRRTVTVSYPWVDLTESAGAEYLVANKDAADVLKAYVSNDTTHTTDAVYAEDGEDNILSEGKIDTATLAGGANVLLFKDNDTYGYILSVTVVTKTIGDASEFKAWREANHGDNNTGFYAYGKGEYVLLRTDITIDEANWGAYRNAAYSGYLDGKEVGFLGTFDGGGNTITVQSAGTGGLFGDLGNGSVIKNLGVVAQLTSTGGSRPAALAALAEGATIDNCYIQAKTGGENSYGGVVIAGVASVTMTNCVIDSTPGNDANSAWSAVFTSYVRRGWEENLKFENVVGISRTAGNTVFARVMNDAGNAYTDQNTGVTVVDGSAAGFDIETHKLADFDASGFNSECFFVEEGYIPLWHALATDIQPELAFNESSVDITTDKEADNSSAQLKYSFTYRGSDITPDAVEWAVTSGSEYAEVTQEGVVTGTDMGTAEVTLTVTYNKIEYTATITVNVTIPTEDVTPKQEMLFDKSTDTSFDADALAEAIWGADSGKTITDLRYGSAAASATIVSGSAYDWAKVPAGEERVFYAVADDVAYKFTALVVSRQIGSADEFMAWRDETSANAKTYTDGTAAKADVYTYGEGEYILLTADITLTEDLQHKIWLLTAADTVPDGNKVGFLGTFDGSGHTITAQSAGWSGLFGDLGSGAVIKNLGVVATLSNTDGITGIQVRPTALASRAYGVTFENCYFDVTCGTVVRYSGLLFATAADITFENCVIVGTPGNGTAAGTSALVTSFVPINHYNSISFENTVLISRNASNQAIAFNGNNSAFTANVSVIDGSAAGFNIETYRLSGFDDSGFNTEYFFVEEGYIPQWNKTAENYKPEAAITADSVDVTTDAEAGNHTVQLDYTLTYRGTEVTPENIEWSVTSGGTFASVSDAGVVTGRTEGTAEVTLTVTYNRQTYTDTVTVNVTIPTDSVTPAQDVLFDKTNTSYDADALAEAIWGDQTDKVITDLRYGSAAASASIVNDSAYVWTNVPAGEDRVFYAVSDNVAYEFTALVVSRQIGSAEEFMDWRKETSKNAKTYTTQNDAALADVYTYGEGEYILLTSSFTIDGVVNHQVWRQTAPSSIPAGGKVGFLGTFNGNGHTITATVGQSGLFGDLGSGAVVKNLGVVATLNYADVHSVANSGNIQGHPAALACRAYGATIENCYISVKDGCEQTGRRSGVFMTAGNVTIKNSVIVSDSKADNGAVLTEYVHTGYTVTCENVVAVSYNASIQVFARYEGNAECAAGVTLVNGSAAGFDIAAYKLTDFDASGFNTEYFYVEAGYIPQWGKTAADFKPVAAITENSVEVTTETGADGNTAQLSYTFTYRGTPITEGVTVAWTVTSGGTFAAVSQDGKVTGLAEGTAEVTLTVTYDEQEYTATATVDVTMPVQDAELTEDVVFLKSVTDLASSLTAEDVWGESTDKTIADVRCGTAAASASILNDGTLDWADVALGENVFYVVGSDNVAYKFTALVVTKTIGTAEEFMAWRDETSANAKTYTDGTAAKADVYTYGEGEYILLTADITLTEDLQHKIWLLTAADTVPDGNKVGFLGTFDGSGHTITAQSAGWSGLFGDLGSGAVIKNLGVVATLSNTDGITGIQVRPTALASRAYGVTFENCYFDVTCGTVVRYSGLLFATAADITFENCVIVGTPGNGTAAGTSALVTSFVPINHYNSISFENTVLISRNASNQAIAFNGNNSAFTADVTVINGSAADFDITAYELTDFDASGFNTEYFTVTENRIPQWKGAQA